MRHQTVSEMTAAVPAGEANVNDLGVSAALCERTSRLPSPASTTATTTTNALTGKNNKITHSFQHTQLHKLHNIHEDEVT